MLFVHPGCVRSVQQDDRKETVTDCHIEYSKYEIELTILDADVMLAQLLHSMATNTITSRKVVSFGPRISSHNTVAALKRK
jgi:hypothetical protein